MDTFSIFKPEDGMEENLPDCGKIVDQTKEHWFEKWKLKMNGHHTFGNLLVYILNDPSLRRDVPPHEIGFLIKWIKISLGLSNIWEREREYYEQFSY